MFEILVRLTLRMSRAPNIIAWRDGSMRVLASHSADAAINVLGGHH
jgi:hypothetical protein